MAKPEAVAVANAERPLPDTEEAAAAPATTRLKKKVARHSTATARHSSKLRASMDMGAFLSAASALFSRRADSLDRIVTMCASTSRANVSFAILEFFVSQLPGEETTRREIDSQNMFSDRHECHAHFFVNERTAMITDRSRSPPLFVTFEFPDRGLGTDRCSSRSLGSW